ncbi:hypothetical protein DFH07DRAFT_946489 [Mycena maculata]|uniref:Uncharacterized protein n=1 Tax=Mycena maculata TaxID=230809 RepID=A0AAD7MM07_9AGAR|nr:hypothetical protein DFH07DRAFT_946489 [Mycena maculata]
MTGPREDGSFDVQVLLEFPSLFSRPLRKIDQKGELNDLAPNRTGFICSSVLGRVHGLQMRAFRPQVLLVLFGTAVTERGRYHGATCIGAGSVGSIGRAARGCHLRVVNRKSSSVRRADCECESESEKMSCERIVRDGLVQIDDEAGEGAAMDSAGRADVWRARSSGITEQAVPIQFQARSNPEGVYGAQKGMEASQKQAHKSGGSLRINPWEARHCLRIINTCHPPVHLFSS